MDNSIPNLMKYKIMYLLFSLVVLVPGFISIMFKGVNLSIDFTGGTVLVYKMDSNSKPISEEFHRLFSENDVETVSVVPSISNDIVTVRTKPLAVEKNEELKGKILEKYKDLNIDQVSFETVGPLIGKETTKNAFVALFWASVGILFYIAYAFRNIPKPYSSIRFGLSAIIAMLHDAFLVVGIFSIFNIEIDSLFLTALLTVIGFSVHDTIVVFDRVRENLRKLPNQMQFEQIVNFSLVETLSRSIATSLTVLFTLLSLYLLGGDTIKTFSLALLIGIFSGTYSSIFTASPILVLWESKKK